MGVYLKRHFANDPDIASPDSRSSGGLPNPEGSPAQAEGYGLKSAVATGMMDGDRAFQASPWFIHVDKILISLQRRVRFYFSKFNVFPFICAGHLSSEEND